MSSLSASATFTDVAFAVCTALDRAGEHAVLCGGSAATYYAPEAYESELRAEPLYDRRLRDHFLDELRRVVH